MSSSLPTTRAQRRAQLRHDSSNRSARRRVAWIVVGVLVFVLAAVAVIAGVAVSKALIVRDSLSGAIPIASALPSKIVAGDTESATADADALKEFAADAVSETRDGVWGIAEWIPVLGQNLAAIRAAAEGVDDLATFGVSAVPTLNLAAFQPVDGAVDLAAVHSLEEIVSRGAAAFTSVNERLDATDRSFLLPEVDEALGTLDEAVSGVDETLGALAPLLQVLPSALGEDAPRTYLLMFQGNSELRASGGNPAALALVTATAGRIQLTTQATSVQFDNARPESISALDPETENLYSDIIGRWIPNMTATPDFPTTVEIMRAWWADEGLPPFDDVISTDPVALSYLLKTTGPIPLDTGEILTSENAVPLLLNEVYFKYGEGTGGAEQDLFFAAAAAKIFTALTSGTSDPLTFLDVLRQSTEEGRMKLWSSDPAIQNLIGDGRLSGTLPPTNDVRTIAGVYFNDTTGAKTDYYADASITSTAQCSASGEPTFSQVITFANNITSEQATDLPYFITGPHYRAGDIATDVVVYGPVGATIESWNVEGAASYTLMAEGPHLGRNAVRISVLTPPQTVATITVTMKGAGGVSGSEYGPYEVWTTPMVRETPITIEKLGCG